MSQTKYKPLSDRVIVEQETAETTTQSGIVLPDAAQEKPQLAKVVKVGPGRVTDDGKLIPMSLQEGDKVIFAKYGGTTIKDGDRDLLIIKESDVLAVQEG